MEAVQVKSGEESFRRNRNITTVIIYYCTFALGVVNNMLGPALIDFSNKFGTDVDKVSVVVTILTGAYLVGAFSYGFLSKFVPRMLLIVGFLIAMSGTQFIIPFLSSMPVFFVICAVTGIGAGGYDCGQVAWIIEIWRGDASVWILTQHFMYSLGTTVPALLLAPFLNGEEEDEFTTTTPEASLDPTSSTIPPEPFKSELAVPFIVAGILGAIGVALQIFLGFKSNTKSESQTQSKQMPLDEKQVESADDFPPTAAPTALNLNNSLAYTILLTVLSCCILGAYQGMEITILQFIPTFSVYSDVGLTEQQGARILTGFTVAFAVGRFLGIFVVMRVQPQFILVVNFAMIIAGNFIILFGGGSNETMLWVGCIMLGAGGSTVYPSFYAYIEKYLYVTDTIAAIITVSGGAVGAIYPLIVGNIIKDTPSILIYVNFFSITLCISSFVTVFWLTKIRKPKNKTSD